MLRRRAIAILAASPGAFANRASLDEYLDSPRGAAVLVDIASKRLIAVGGASTASRRLEPPGSTVKPFVLGALIESARWKQETFLCPRRLRIGGRSFDCVHPDLNAPVDVASAIAYSCNCYVAHVAERFETGELARSLDRFGLGSRTGFFGAEEAAGRIRPSASDEQRIQALGEQNVEVTTVELAMAYRLLALNAAKPVLEGLEGAVEFGTAQNARIANARVAGKTGSAMNRQGEPLAWFAGFMPAASPRVALAVMLPGRSGGADAAPVARRIFEAYLAGSL
jgi:penicillin-binding protein A